MSRQPRDAEQFRAEPGTIPHEALEAWGSQEVEQRWLLGDLCKRAGTASDFHKLFACQNIFDPIHRDWRTDAICIRIALAYEKHTTVLY